MQPQDKTNSNDDSKSSGGLNSVDRAKAANPAADVIRQKINALYSHEPDAKDEASEVRQLKVRTKHQDVMYKLTTSGLSLADIQTKWHEYYTQLPDKEKHEVWQEFYSAQNQVSHHQATHPSHHKAEPAKVIQAPMTNPLLAQPDNPEVHSVAEVKNQLLGKVRTRNKMSVSHHARSLAFGLGMGALVVLVLLFSFFNERIIAPLITPSRNVSNTPIIIDPNSPVTDKVPKIIIPKINVEIPVVYNEPSVEEHAVQAALERGVVHYANTPLPGERGNAAIFGHSSNNILNRGKYKFAFVLLSRLEVDDTFYLTKDGKRYVYRIYDKRIVAPTDTWVLGKTDKTASVTLITCDPPGTTLKRLVVFGEQITPDPSSNIASSVTGPTDEVQVIPSNGQSLWSRITSWF